MTTSGRVLTLLLISVFCLAERATVEAVTVVVVQFGDDGWTSGDTRADGYTDINGGSQLVLGRERTDSPPLLEDTLISPRLNFAMALATPTMGPGAARLVTDASGDKATLDRRDFNSPFDGSITLEYAWYRVAGSSVSVAAPALKLLVDTSEINPAGPQAEDRFETVGDKILVYEPYQQTGGSLADDLWTTESVDPATGLFWLVNLATSSALPATNADDLRTLEQWQSAFSDAGESGSTINSLQLGIGAGNPNLDSYVDYVSFSSGVESTTWNFEAIGATVPEPSAILLTAISLLGIKSHRSRRHALRR